MKGILFLIQIMVLGAAYGVFFNQWVEPSFFPYFNLLSLGFPVIFVLNFILLLIWWLYRWKLALVFTLLSLVLLIPMNKTYHIFGKAETDTHNLKLFTNNVQYFFGDRDGVIAFMKKEDADIVLFQELGRKPLDAIEKGTKGKPYYVEEFNSLLIASKYPILEAQAFKLKRSIPRTFCYADILFHHDTIRVINFYLESLHLNQEEIKNAEVNAELKNTGKNLARKVIKASQIHQQQIQTMREKISESPYPVIVAGDMNSVPNSYEYYAIGRGLKDAFLNGGKGLGTTFPGFGYPLRLDYVFVSPEIQVKDYRIEKTKHSDHFPVIVELEIPTK